MESKRKNSTSGYTGVTFDYRSLCWRAQKSINGTNIYIGSYLTKEQANEARIRYDEKLKNESINVIILDKSPVEISPDNIQITLF